MENLRIVRVVHSDELKAAHKVREMVFQNEQGISSESDFDGLDTDPNTTNFVAFSDVENPVGTARVRLVDGRNKAKVERVAVLESARGNKVGVRIMEAIERHLLEEHIPMAFLDSQLSAKPFYEKLGYMQEGEVFDEVGTPHVKMVKHLIE